MENKKIIDNFLKQLKNEHNQEKSFVTLCLKCESSNVEFSYSGDGGPVAKGSYTAGFDGQHFIKCKDCGNAVTKEFYIDMNGAFNE